MILIVTFLFVLASIGIIVSIKSRLIRTIIVIFIITPITLLIVSFIVEDYRFFKADAIKFLKTDDISIDNHFSIKSHHIYEDLHGGYEEFTLELSSENKNKVIQQIKFSPYFVDSTVQNANFQTEIGRCVSKQVIRDYPIDCAYIRETYEMTKGHKTNHDIISISKDGSSLTFQRY